MINIKKELNMCKNRKCKSLIYKCNRESCNKIVHYKKGCRLKAHDYTGALNFADWKFCEDCFSEIVEIIADFNKSDLTDLYAKIRRLLLGENKKISDLKDDLKKLKNMYEGKYHKEKCYVG
jgi:hypothetical protein